MLKKKRLFMVAVAAAVVVVGWQYGFDIALGLLALLGVLLGVLYVYRVMTARRGLAKLAALREQYGYDRLIEGAKAAEPGNGSFTFVVLGDTRNARDVASRVYKAAADEKPSLVFNTGDIIRHGTPEEFLKNHVPLLGITDPVPMFCVPGNHERGARRDFAAFKGLYGGDRFAFRFGSCLFAGFNNSGRGHVRDEDLAFLAEALSDASAQHKFVFCHIPPAYFEGTFVDDDRRRGFERNADAFRQLMTRQGVDEVFFAHIHGFATAVIDDVRYTLTAGGGAPLSKRLAPEGRVYHYVTLEVGPEGVKRELVYLDDGAWVRKSL